MINTKLISDLTLEKIEHLENRLYGPIADEQKQFPLPRWYDSIRKIPIKDLSIEDICKLCRQKFFFDYILPIAIELLTKDPNAGELYKGELLNAIKQISNEDWNMIKDYKSITSKLRELIQTALENDILSNEIIGDAKDIALETITRLEKIPRSAKSSLT
ncbi:MAG: contact-dependent growth inhibition system immunity protein [bacterium]